MDPNIYNIVVVGSGSVGKSALTIRFVQSYFVDEYDPTIEDSYRRQYIVDDQTCLLNILDTAGQDEYSAMRDHYMREGEGFICVFSLTSSGSLQELPKFIGNIARVKDTDYCQLSLIIVGNKLDLIEQREVNRSDAIALAKTFGAAYFETSAKFGNNVNEIYCQMVRIINQHRERVSIKQKTKYSHCTIL